MTENPGIILTICFFSTSTTASSWWLIFVQTATAKYLESLDQIIAAFARISNPFESFSVPVDGPPIAISLPLKRATYFPLGEDNSTEYSQGEIGSDIIKYYLSPSLRSTKYACLAALSRVYDYGCSEVYGYLDNILEYLYDRSCVKKLSLLF